MLDGGILDRLVFRDWLGLGDDAWRYAMLMNGAVSFIYGFMYYFLVTDHPENNPVPKTKKAAPMMVSSYLDLAQYIVWSFPLMGAMGVLAWRIGGIKINGIPLITQEILTIVYVILALVYIAHVIKTLQINLPYLKAGVPEEEKYNWSSVAALNSTYFANFGSELAVVSMLPMFFESTFSKLTSGDGNFIMTATLAGLIASSFAFVNLFARPLGGLLSDTMKNRKKTMLIYMIGIAFGFLGMAHIGEWGPVVNGVQTVVPMFEGMSWLIVSIGITIIASIFVQGAEGATFAVIPMINKKMTGQIAGMAGAYGNVGAVIYLVIYSLVDAKTFFFIIAAGAFLSFFFCWMFLEEPKGSFEDEITR